MPTPSLKLAIGTNALEIKAFTTYRPSMVGGGAPTYSLSGTAVDGGVSHDPKMLWEIGAILEYEQMLMLKLLFASSDQLRRSLAPYSLLIFDTITPIVEVGTTNTRAIVPTLTAAPIGVGAISYFAQYYGGFVAPPKIEPYPTGIYQVDFSIAEHDRVLP